MHERIVLNDVNHIKSSFTDTKGNISFIIMQKHYWR